MGLFGIDFNRDGEISDCEEMMDIGLTALTIDLLQADKAQRRADRENKIVQEEFVRDCRRKQAALEEQLAKLEEQLFELENNEPEDILSERYDRWEEKCWRLEEQIMDKEAEISEHEEVVESELGF